jgi:hypothetical protein
LSLVKVLAIDTEGMLVLCCCFVVMGVSLDTSSVQRNLRASELCENST